MRRRIAVAAVMAVGVVLALVGCTFFAPQATLIKYDPSDGVSLNVGNVELRNAFVVSPEGADANLVGVLINSGKSAVTVNLQYTSHSTGKATRETVSVGMQAGEVISFGNPKVKQLVFQDINVQPGSLFRIFVQYGGVSGKNVRVPVLNGEESAYSALTPSPTPTAPIACGDTAGGSATGSATASPTATPTPDPTASTPTVGCPNPFATSTAAPVTK